MGLALIAQSNPLQWMSFEVIDPRASGGHRILYLQDVLRPNPEAPVPGLPSARAVLIFSLAPAECGLSEGVDRCAELSQLVQWAKKRGGLVIGVLLNDEQEAPELKARLQQARLPFSVVADSYQVWRSLLKLSAPGSFLIVRPEDLAADTPASLLRLAPLAADGADARARLLSRVKAAFKQAMEGSL